MARTVNEQEYTQKRNKILDAAQRLIFAKGYERMTLQDILDDLHISSGALYHYFDSRQAVLGALAERMQDEIEQRVLPIVYDPDLPGNEKLRRFFATVLRREISTDAQTVIIALLRIWFTDDNALIRQKVDAARVERLAPLLSEIVCQGTREGSFSTSHPDLIGEVILYLIQGLQYTLARLHAAFEMERDEQRYIESIISAYDTYMDTIEHSLGIPSPLLYRLDPGAVKESLAIYESMYDERRQPKYQDK